MRQVRVEAQDGWWLAASRPHPALRPFLNSYDGYWEDAPLPSRMRTLPTRTAVVIVNLGPQMLLAVPGGAATPFGSFVAGMHDGHGSYVAPGAQRGIQLDMTPLGAYTLLGLPMRHLTNAAVDLPDLLGPAFTGLVERLAAAPSWADRFDLLDAFWLGRLDVGPRPSPEVALAWQALDASGGRTGIADLAGEVGWSRKHLTHRFHEQVGLPPKVMARVLRFQRARAMLAGGSSDLAAVALACGYYDQAHLNREFRALAGWTPTELLARHRPERLG